MIAKKIIFSAIAITTVLMLMFISSCTRDEGDLTPATFPVNSEVFADGFSAGLNYAAFGGSKVTAFEVDTEVKFEGTASMRISVPDFGDPEGAYAGGVYFTSTGRDLSGFNVLTFWARASKAANIDLLGFGNDLGELKYVATITNVAVNTNWNKYYIPIPDPSVLTEEKGMFFYSEGPEEGKGYTFWIDEVRFENLGTIAHERHAILKGEEIEISAETGEKPVLDSLTSTFNLPTGIDQVVNVSPSYFEFSSSNTNVAVVDSKGVISVLDAGNAEITATLAGEDAGGKLTIESLGAPVKPEDAATAPDRDANDVTSIFSNAYADVNVDFFNGYWLNSTTESFDTKVGDDDDVIRYRNLNFVGIQFTSPTIDITDRNHIHMDIWTPDPTEIADFKIELVDIGADGSFGGDDDTSGGVTVTNPKLETEKWISIDLPLSAFIGLTNRNKLAQIVLSSETITNVFVDNIYFYYEEIEEAEPTEAAPAPTQSESNVISLFSDAYTDVAVDTWRTDWSNASFEDINIEGNPTKKYSNLDFVGIETGTSQVDASGMTHFHFDVWSTNFTQFSIKLVDFGADGAFGGDDDVEHQLDFASPVQNDWVSMDIPLSDFTNLTTTSNIAQYIFVGQPTGLTTVYLDNIFFYNNDGGGGATEPTEAAPTPTQSESNVVSLFSDAYTDVTVDTWRTDWSSAVFEDVTIAGNATKKYSSLDFVGIETVANTVNASGMSHLHFDVWSPDFTQVSIKLVDFGPDGAFDGGDDTEHQLDFSAPNQGEWVSMDIPLSDFTNLTTTGNMAQYIFVGQPTGTTTIFLDNIFFYNEDGGGATEPTVAAPTPTQSESDVVSLFSDAYTDVTVDTWRTDWSSAVFEDVTIDGNATKKYSSLDFVGIETVASTVDASGMSHLHFDVWSPDFTQVSIKLVDFGPDGAFDGGDDTEHQLDFAAPNQGEWVSMDIPLSDFTNLTTTGSMAQYIFVGQPTGTTTIFLDNIFFYNEGGGGATEPTVAAPTPTQNESDVVSLFSDAYTDVTVDTWRTDWSSAVFEDVTIAGNATKKYSSLDFVGIETVASTVDASGMSHLHFDVWSPDFTQVSIKLVDFGPDGAFDGGDDTEHQLDFAAPNQGEWVSMDIPLGDFTNLTTTGNMAQYIFVGQPTGTTTIFLDNIFFYNEGGGGATEPTVAAPTPTRAEADVVSLFSDAYTDVTVDTWRTDWSSATFEDVTIAGNATKKYSDLDFVGIETVANQVDASGMTHIHLDVWSPNFTQFSIKLVDFGADGAFGGGDDVEHQLDFAAPNQGEWVSMDIPLSDFINLTTTSNMAQYILVGQPTGTTTVFVDNIYFYK